MPDLSKTKSPTSLLVLLSIVFSLLSEQALAAYCDASGSNLYHYIKGVQVGSINNMPTGNSIYADYTSLSTTMMPEVGYPITVTRGNPWDPVYDYCRTWVDWNQDEDFYDVGEEIVMSLGVDPCTFTGTITPPAGAVEGNTRMRVRIVWNETPLPCGGSNYGEVEDYTIKISVLYDGGTGTVGDPYLIRTAEQMNAIGAEPNDWDKHFKLVADIDLSAFTGTAFNIIGYHVALGDPDDKPFNGVFDGNGHTISNFTYSSTGINFVGIFSYAWDAEIKNLGLINPNVNVEAGDGVGPLAGVVEGTVSNCYARGGSVTGDLGVGGLLGAHFGHISESFADVNVYGQTGVGGLIGTIGLAPLFTSITVENCYALGNVDGNDYVGGLVGDLSDGVICNSYSAGHVSGTGDFVGGLVGKFYDLPVVINSYWDVNTSGQTDSTGGTGKTTPEMMAEETFVGWGCNGAWTINDHNDYPRLAWENKPGELITNPSTYWQGNGTPADPYLIYTPQEFNIIGLVPCAWDKCFKLMADIDMSGIAPAQYNSIGKGIGFEFTGTFDGNNHLISNFSCGNTNERSIGMFGFVRGDANIMNLALFEPNVDSGDNSPVGALVGFLVSGNIDNCSVINGYVRGISEVGGLVGEIDNFLEYATISNCYTTCSVEGTGYRIGGLVGVIDNGAVSRSFSTASVTGQGSIGGLVGRNEGTISNSYATGSVTATDRYGGGLAGRNRTTIGGEGYISNSYSTGRVTGSSSGGFVAISSIPTSNCFWDKETSGKSSSAGGETGLMTEQMQTKSTFTDAGWDFVGETVNGPNDIWDICEGTNYPRLVWQIPLGVFLCPEGVNFFDFSFFAEQWAEENCAASNDCDGRDLDQLGSVDIKDLRIFADNWLAGL